MRIFIDDKHITYQEGRQFDQGVLFDIPVAFQYGGKGTPGERHTLYFLQEFNGHIKQLSIEELRELTRQEVN